jgi:hypothetical protein
MTEELLFVKSPHWKYFQQWIEEKNKREMNALIHATTDSAFAVSQGKLRVYQELLALKDQWT